MSYALRIPRFARIPPFTVLAGLLLSGCGINNIPTYDENAKAKWSDVQNQYQRRADLIPNLVETVKGYAAQERQVLTQVTEARAKVSQIKVDASTITDPAKFKEYQDAQNALTGTLGRLLVTVEGCQFPLDPRQRASRFLEPRLGFLQGGLGVPGCHIELL